MKKITVAVASYNNSDYLERCINSVLNQSFRDFELLVIDDGSTDKTVDICEKYSRRNLISFIQKENGGLSSARQIAIELSRSKYICFIDADDYLQEAYLEKMLIAIERDDSDLAICNTYFLDSNGNRIDSPANFSSYQDSESVIINEKMIRDSFSCLANIYTLSDSWNKLYKVSFIRENGLCFNLSKGFNGSDLLFNHKVIFHMPKIAFSSYFGYNHVVYKSSAVHRKNKRLFYGFSEIYRKIEEEALKTDLNERILDSLGNLYLTMMRDGYLDALAEFSGKSRMNVLKQIIREAKMEQKGLLVGKDKKWKTKKMSLALFRRVMFKPFFASFYLKILSFKS